MKGQIVKIGVVSIILLIALTACGQSGSEGGSGELFLPPVGFVAEPVQGQPLFEKNCSSCHGLGGKGTDQGPPLVHTIYEPNHHGDMAFYMAAKKGVRHHHWDFGDMPPVSGVSASDVGHIIAYIRRQQRRAGIGTR